MFVLFGYPVTSFAVDVLRGGEEDSGLRNSGTRISRAGGARSEDRVVDPSYNCATNLMQ